MGTKNRKLGRGMESLEQKAMMAGDVSIAVTGGDLHIVEGDDWDDANAAQQIQVQQLKGGMVRVQGLGKTGIDTVVVEGREVAVRGSYVDVPVSDDIYIDLAGGNDDVYFSSVNGGVQADKVEIDTGSGDDYVSITGMDTRSGVEIETHSGADDVVISNSTIGDSSWEDLKIKTGSGGDSVRVLTTTVADDVDVKTFENDSEADADELTVDNVTARDIIAKLGNGRDDAVVKFSTIANNIDLELGYEGGGLNDNDYAFIGFNDVGDDIEIDGEDGDDEVRAAYNTVGDKFRFDGDDGNDEFFIWTANGVNSNDVGEYDINDAAFRTYGY